MAEKGVLGGGFRYLPVDRTIAVELSLLAVRNLIALRLPPTDAAEFSDLRPVARTNGLLSTAGSSLAITRTPGPEGGALVFRFLPVALASEPPQFRTVKSSFSLPVGEVWKSG